MEAADTDGAGAEGGRLAEAKTRAVLPRRPLEPCTASIFGASLWLRRLGQAASFAGRLFTLCVGPLCCGGCARPPISVHDAPTCAASTAATVGAEATVVSTTCTAAAAAAAAWSTATCKACSSAAAEPLCPVCQGCAQLPAAGTTAAAAEDASMSDSRPLMLTAWCNACRINTQTQER